MFLQYAQQFSLQFQGNLTDFIEKESAARSQMKTSDPMQIQQMFRDY